MKKGFTLVELVIVTAIIIGISGFGTANYLSFNEKQTIEQAAKTVKNNLRLIQQKAIAGEKDSGVCGPQALAGWCLSPDDSTTANAYKLYGTCGDPADGVTLFPAVPVSFDMPAGVTLTSRVYNDSIPGWEGEGERIRFGVLDGTVAFRELSHSKVTFCLQGNLPSLDADDSYAITVSRTGEIIDEGYTSNCYP